MQLYFVLTLSVPAHVIQYTGEKKTCTRYRATCTYVLNKNPGFMALGAKPMSHFCGSTFFGN